MALNRKAVIVRKFAGDGFSRTWCAGYAPTSFASNPTELEILDSGGKTITLGWELVKWVCYVRDFPSAGGDQTNPERLLHKRFTVRPRTAGLWLRMTLTDGEELEGLATNDRSLIEGPGLFLTPPDTRANTQRIFVPRLAIQTLEVAGLIGTARAKRAPDRVEQAELFSSDAEGA
jgi:hypothetical protein